MGRKELALLIASTLFTLLLAVGLIRWLAPSLLGGPTDLQLVKTSKEVPPFYEGVFRPEQFRTTDFLLKDPRTVNRAQPFMGEIPQIALGPHDVLGFRNRVVPAVADVVTIGDSQTYGVNVLLEDNWPSQMARALPGASVYSMAIGGWGAVQYADMFANAAAFRPRVVVVAFYTGNDPLDSFGLAYGAEQWRALRPENSLRASDAPSASFPPPESEWWTPTIGGRSIGFIPKFRLLSNSNTPVVEAGYGVMRKAAQAMSAIAQKAGFRAAMIVVPTKELVYAPRIVAEKIDAPAEFHELVHAEQRHAKELCAYFASLPSTSCVDVVAPLQAGALRRMDLYPENINGHPLTEGYRIIGETVAHAIADLLPTRPDGLVYVSQEAEGRSVTIFLIRDGIAWMFASGQLVEANGWRSDEARHVDIRDLAGLPKRLLTDVNRKRYGPRR